MSQSVPSELEPTTLPPDPAAMDSAMDAALDGAMDGAMVTPAGHRIVLQSLAQAAPVPQAPKPEPVSDVLEATDVDDAPMDAERSGRARRILQQLITAVQEQEALAAQSEPELSVPEVAAPTVPVAATPVVATPELSPEELERYNRMQLKAGDVCPACGQGTLVLRQSGKVAFLGCSCYPHCKLRYFTRHLSPVQTIKLLSSLCPHCNEPLAVKKGRYGLFIGCSNYPNCTYSPKEAAAEQAIACPMCQQGVLRQRRSSSGKIFYGCDHYPQCDFKLMGAPYLKTCPECGFPLRFKKKVKAGIALVCARPQCPSRKRRKYDLLTE